MNWIYLKKNVFVCVVYFHFKIVLLHLIAMCVDVNFIYVCTVAGVVRYVIWMSFC